MYEAARGLLGLLGVAALVTVACGDDDGEGRYEVTTQTVSDPTTQDILLLEPDAEDRWPVVLALHGIDGDAEQMAPLAERVAATGALVFAPDYRTDVTTEQGIIDLVRDTECGYRYARTVAGDHGGDLARPVAWVGWSLGAVVAVQAGLDETLDPTGGDIVTCFTDVPRPDVIVAVDGCYEEVGAAFDPGEWSNADAKLVVVAGEDDTVCPPDQSERLVDELDRRGYDAQLVRLEGADHFAPVFHRYVDGDMVETPGSAAGDRVVQLIADALGT